MKSPSAFKWLPKNHTENEHSEKDGYTQNSDLFARGKFIRVGGTARKDGRSR